MRLRESHGRANAVLQRRTNRASQPAFGPPAPASRFIVTSEDIYVDQATLPENVEIRRRLDGG